MTDPNPQKSKLLLAELRHLDWCMSAGEEPWEIEREVLALGDLAAEELHLWMCKKGVFVPPDVIRPFLSSLFINTYLVNWAPNSTIAKLNRPKIAQFFEPFNDGPFMNSKAYLTPFELLSLLFRFLQDIGYEISLERLQRAVAAVEKDMRKEPLRRTRQQELQNKSDVLPNGSPKESPNGNS